MRLTVMIEGQEGVTWPQWLDLAEAAERHGYDALLRSDHYFSVEGDEGRGALDAWGTVCALAAVTERIRLGTLVSPVTFRPAAVLAKLALTADHVSGGRIDVGMGTGWWETEHEAFGLPFPPMRERMDELERQLEAVTRFWAETPPPPVQQPRPHLMLGGSAKARSARLAARYADEYNMLYVSPEDVRERAARLRSACEEAGRTRPLRLSLMTGFVVGADDADIRARAARLAGGGDVDEFLASRRERHWLIGTPAEVVERLRAYAEVGIERVMLQHHLHDDLEQLALIGAEVLPRVAAG